MLSTSALTWAAAQLNVPVYELIRSLSATDERRIEAAYAEWRRRAVAGERRHKVDWRTHPLSADQEAEVVTAVQEPVPVPIHANEPILASIEDVEADEIGEPDQAADEAPWEEAADPDVADAVEQIMAVEEPEYISLDDFNLEPSEAEMKAMEKTLASDLSSTEEEQDLFGEAEGEVVAAEEEKVPIGEVAEEIVPTEVSEEAPPAKDEQIETIPATEAEEAPEEVPSTEDERGEEAAETPIELRISKLPKDAVKPSDDFMLFGECGGRD